MRSLRCEKEAQIAYLYTQAEKCAPWGARGLLILGKDSATLPAGGLRFTIDFATWKITVK